GPYNETCNGSGRSHSCLCRSFAESRAEEIPWKRSWRSCPPASYGPTEYREPAAPTSRLLPASPGRENICRQQALRPRVCPDGESECTAPPTESICAEPPSPPALEQ